MDFIKSRLGPNKVFTPIKTNKYEESVAIKELFQHVLKDEMFGKMDNIIDQFRVPHHSSSFLRRGEYESNRNLVRQANPRRGEVVTCKASAANEVSMTNEASAANEVSMTNEASAANEVSMTNEARGASVMSATQPSLRPSEVVTCKASVTNEVRGARVKNRVMEVSAANETNADTILHALLILFEPSISLLYNVHDINVKVTKFKETLKNDLTNHNQYYKKCLKDNGKLETIIEALENSSLKIEERVVLFIYVSKVLGQSIMIRSGSEILLTTLVPSSINGVVFEWSRDDQTIRVISEELTNASLIDIVIQGYRDANLVNTIDKMLVSNLKDIAASLNLDAFKIENGKKKPLLKGELKSVILEKIDLREPI